MTEYHGNQTEDLSYFHFYNMTEQNISVIQMVPCDTFLVSSEIHKKFTFFTLVYLNKIDTWSQRITGNILFRNTVKIEIW